MKQITVDAKYYPKQQVTVIVIKGTDQANVRNWITKEVLAVVQELKTKIPNNTKVFSYRTSYKNDGIYKGKFMDIQARIGFSMFPQEYLVGEEHA